MSWIIGRSAGSTQPSRGRVSLSLHSCQNPQFGMAINNIPLLEITDFGPPARGGHFVLFHSFLPPQPYGTQFHSVHTSPVQLVSLALPHVGGRESFLVLKACHYEEKTSRAECEAACRKDKLSAGQVGRLGVTFKARRSDRAEYKIAYTE